MSAKKTKSSTKTSKVIPDSKNVNPDSKNVIPGLIRDLPRNSRTPKKMLNQVQHDEINSQPDATTIPSSSGLTRGSTKPTSNPLEKKHTNQQKTLTEQVSEKTNAVTSSNAPRKNRRLFFFLILFLIGINALILGYVYHQYRELTLSFKAAPITQVELHQRRGTPTHIQIPSQKISLTVEEAQIVDGVWQTSKDNATHLDASARPGEGGNIVIYGHNLLRIFGLIRNLKVGDKITITTSEGLSREYTVDETQTVKPTQVEVVLPTDYEKLTLYTCTGFLDSMRFVVTAKPTKVSSW